MVNRKPREVLLVNDFKMPHFSLSKKRFETFEDRFKHTFLSIHRYRSSLSRSITAYCESDSALPQRDRFYETTFQTCKGFRRGATSRAETTFRRHLFFCTEKKQKLSYQQRKLHGPWKSSVKMVVLNNRTCFQRLLCHPFTDPKGCSRLFFSGAKLEGNP